jgi:hypothetical protein
MHGLKSSSCFHRRKVIFSAFLSAVAFGVLACNSEPRSESLRPYVIPAEITLKAAAARGPEGEMLISGTTNLPDGTKLWVFVKQPNWMPKAASRYLWGIAGDDHVLVRNGAFRTKPLWIELQNKHFTVTMEKWPDAEFRKFRRKPLPSGKYSVWICAYFTSGWQNARIAQLLGEGGKTLRGPQLKETDPDVSDSDRTLDYTAPMTFPNLSREAEAIALVRASRLNVPGLGRSANDIEANINGLFTAEPDLRPNKGWSAKAGNADTYEVQFDFINGQAGEEQAIWSANL